MSTHPFTSPAALNAALRDAAAQGIDGLLALQKEVSAAAIKGLEQLRTEQDRVGAGQAAALRQIAEAQVQIAEKALGWWRDRVVSAGGGEGPRA